MLRLSGRIKRGSTRRSQTDMKKFALILVSCVSVIQTQAQLFRPEAVEGALWGSLIGGIAGREHCYGFSGRGAAIGAGVGLLAGSIIGESRRYSYCDTPGYVYATTPGVNVSFGYGYGDCGSSAYVYYAPNRYCAPGYYYRPTRPNYAVNGVVLGAATGALIGAADDHAGNGAAIGAATGLVLGSLAEHTTRKEERRVATQTVTSVPTTQVATPNSETPAIKSGITSQPSATSTYHWTSRPQIADAPRVPDAPTF